MNKRTAKLLKAHNEDLDRINKQRQYWLYASSIVFIGIISLIFSWDIIDQLHSKQIWWVIVSLMLIVSINWWYWTMKVIRRILEHQTAEFELIMCIMNDIQIVKEDIKFLDPNSVDKSK